MFKEESKTLQRKKYYRAKELAEYLGLGKSTIWKMAQKGLITPKKLSSRMTVFNIDEVEKSLFCKNEVA